MAFVIWCRCCDQTGTVCLLKVTAVRQATMTLRLYRQVHRSKLSSRSQFARAQLQASRVQSLQRNLPGIYIYTLHRNTRNASRYARCVISAQMPILEWKLMNWHSIQYIKSRINVRHSLMCHFPILCKLKNSIYVTSAATLRASEIFNYTKHCAVSLW